jgi:hypothetical protein
MNDQIIPDPETNAVNRQRIFVLLDGTFVVRWQENRVQELQTGQSRAFAKRDYGAPITDYELRQLLEAGIVEHFDDEQVWLCPLPQHYEVRFQTMWEQMRVRSYYLNTTLMGMRLTDVKNALAEHALEDDFLPRLRDNFVVLWARNGVAFHKFIEAEAARTLLISTAPQLFSETVVAFVETSMK